MADLIQRWLAEFAVRLRGGRRWKQRVLGEVERHLREAAAEERAHGGNGGEGERRAVERFGSPKEIAEAFERERPGWRRRKVRAAVAVAAVAASVLAALVVADAFRSDESPPEVALEDSTPGSGSERSERGAPAAGSEAPRDTRRDAGSSSGEFVAVADRRLPALANMSVFLVAQDPARAVEVSRFFRRSREGARPLRETGRILLGNVGPKGESIVAYQTRGGAVGWGMGGPAALTWNFTDEVPAPLVTTTPNPVSPGEETRVMLYGIIPNEVVDVVAVIDGRELPAVIGHNAFVVQYRDALSVPDKQRSGEGPLSRGADALLLGLADGTTKVVPVDCSPGVASSCPEPRPLRDRWDWDVPVPGVPVPTSKSLVRAAENGASGGAPEADPETTRRVARAGRGTPRELEILIARSADGTTRCLTARDTKTTQPFWCLGPHPGSAQPLQFDGPLHVELRREAAGQGRLGPGRVSAFALAGLVRSDVERVAVVLRNGRERSLRLNAHRGFGYDTARSGRVPVSIRAYGRRGVVLSELQVATVGPGCSFAHASCAAATAPAQTARPAAPPKILSRLTNSRSTAVPVHPRTREASQRLRKLLEARHQARGGRPGVEASGVQLAPGSSVTQRLRTRHAGRAWSMITFETAAGRECFGLVRITRILSISCELEPVPGRRPRTILGPTENGWEDGAGWREIALWGRADSSVATLLVLHTDCTVRPVISDRDGWFFYLSEPDELDSDVWPRRLLAYDARGNLITQKWLHSGTPPPERSQRNRRPPSEGAGVVEARQGESPAPSARPQRCGPVT